MNDYIIELKFHKMSVGVSAETKEDAIAQMRYYLMDNMLDEMFIVKEMTDFRPIFFQKYEHASGSTQCGGKPRFLKELK
jgi:hypothetical protein